MDEDALLKSMLRSKFWNWWKGVLETRLKRAIAMAGKAKTATEQSILVGAMSELSSLLALPEMLLSQLSTKDLPDEGALDKDAPFGGKIGKPSVL